MPKFRMTTSAQVERTYVVEAADEKQAHDRLRTHMKDADLVREGLVEAKPDETKNTSPEKIRRAVEFGLVKEGANDTKPGAGTGAAAGPARKAS